jgi:signal transduction histidine kinase
VGLGLSLVRHIVDAHGGRVTVESAVGRGSTFSIHIPLSAACEEA